MTSVGGHLEYLHLRNLRPDTIRQRRLFLERLERELGHDPLDATPLELAQWWSTLANRPSARTGTPPGADARASYLSHMQQFYAWAVREGWLTQDPSTRLVRPKLHRRVPRPIREDHLEEAIERAPDPLRCWFILAAYAGLRACEIARLRREDVNDGSSPLSITVADGKGGNARVVPVSDVVVAAVLRHAPIRGWCWKATNGVDHIPPHRVSQRANEYLHEELGIPDTLHKLRHRFATRVYAESGDLRVTQELLGHASPATTAIYADWSREAAVRAVNAVAKPAHPHTA